MKTSRMFEPLSMGSIRFKNRIALAPMTRARAGATRVANEMMAEGNADMIAIGRPYIANPDLPERFRNDWPLNPCDDMSLWYCPGEKGYTDYAPYEAG